jgi:hypothetical protein
MVLQELDASPSLERFTTLYLQTAIKTFSHNPQLSSSLFLFVSHLALPRSHSPKKQAFVVVYLNFYLFSFLARWRVLATKEFYIN